MEAKARFVEQPIGMIGLRQVGNVGRAEAVAMVVDDHRELVIAQPALQPNSVVASDSTLGIDGVGDRLRDCELEILDSLRRDVSPQFSRTGNNNTSKRDEVGPSGDLERETACCRRPPRWTRPRRAS